MSKGTKQTGQETYSYTYNAFGQRIKKAYSYLNTSAGFQPVYQGMVISSATVYEYDNSGRLIRETVNENHFEGTTSGRTLVYLYDASSVIGVQLTRNGATSKYYYNRNLQGDVTEIYTANGVLKVKYTYDAFGNCTVSGTDTSLGNLNPIRYRGYYYDKETKLYHLGARYYSPEWRRFISPDDTAYIDPESVNGLNLYCYCNNDPINPWLITGIIAAVALFTPVGGTVAQVATSIVSYLGMAVSSIFDEEIRNDMNAIGWNPFNDDESLTINSNKISFYKGVPVFRTKSGGRSGSFGAIFLTKGSNEDILRHERGNNWQLMMMGVGTYGFTVGIPSPLVLGRWGKAGNYYGAPWETMADILCGVKSRTHSKYEIANAWHYYALGTVFFPLTVLYWI